MSEPLWEVTQTRTPSCSYTIPAGTSPHEVFGISDSDNVITWPLVIADTDD